MSKISVTYYTPSKDITPDVKQRALQATNMLEERKFSSHIQMIHLSDHRELAQQIVKQTGGIEEWPLIYIDGNPIGTVKKLSEWLENQEKKPGIFYSFSESATGESLLQRSQKLEEQLLLAEQDGLMEEANELRLSLLETKEKLAELRDSLGEYPEEIDFDSDDSIDHRVIFQKAARSVAEDKLNTKQDPKDIEIGYMGFTLEEIEKRMVGITGLMMSAMNLVLPPSETKDSATIVTEQQTDLIAEFKVIQTNWYYRQQTRLLRFYPNFFERYNPITNTVRAVHKYTDITKIIRTGTTTFSIEYKRSPQDCYQSASASRIIEIINRNTPFDIVTEQQ